MKNKTKIQYLTICGLMCALMCVLAPLSIPIGPIPVSLSILIILISIFVVGTKGTLISYTVYLLLGAFGLPVFSGFQGGVGKLTGPTGGYLIGFLPMILIAGIFYEKSGGKTIPTVAGMILGVAVDYCLGTAWFVIQMDCTVAYAISVCVAPFVIIDLCKIAVANIIGRLIRRPLLKLNLI